MMRLQNKGFTLIEVLVVCVIMGLLIAVVVASLTSARAGNRDAQREVDLQRIKSALDLYYIEHNRTYPSTTGLNPLKNDWLSSESTDSWYKNPPGVAYIPGLVPIYLGILPKDPYVRKSAIITGDCTAASRASFAYKSNGTEYKILAHCSPESIQASDPFYDPVRPTTSWMICEGPTGCTW